MNNSEHIWNASADIFEMILKHPFIVEMIEGTLSTEKFSFYVAQDRMYLRDYSRALSFLAARAPEMTVTNMFARHVANATNVEASLHGRLVKDFRINTEAYRPSPSLVAYKNFLLAMTSSESFHIGLASRAYTDFLIAMTSSEPFHVGLAAVLPCYWIYREVGRYAIRRMKEDNPYILWAEVYSGSAYGSSVQEVLDYIDSLSLSERELEEMKETYRIGAFYEYEFWDSAYRMETWPVSILK